MCPLLIRSMGRKVLSMFAHLYCDCIDIWYFLKNTVLKKGQFVCPFWNKIMHASSMQAIQHMVYITTNVLNVLLAKTRMVYFYLKFIVRDLTQNKYTEFDQITNGLIYKGTLSYGDASIWSVLAPCKHVPVECKNLAKTLRPWVAISYQVWYSVMYLICFR